MAERVQRNRSRFDIYHDILASATDAKTRTRLMNSVNLPTDVFRRYLDTLAGAKLIVGTPLGFKTTPLGLSYIARFQALKGMVDG